MEAHPKPHTIRLKGKAYQVFRKEVFELNGGMCSACGRFAPMYNKAGYFDVFSCGHVSHNKSRGAGGSDILGNVTWKCYDCHIVKNHGPRWTKTLKEE